MDSLNKGINSIHQKVNLLTSYSHILKNKSQKIQLPSNMKKLMIDSGAYDLLIRGKLDEYPFSPKEYAEAMNNLEIQPDYVVSMDYICSREEKNNNQELIKKTIKNAYILRKEFGRSEKICFIPVVQGYSLEEYLFCLGNLVKKRIVQNNDHIGIGSLVGRRNLKETREIIKSIYNFLRKNNIAVNIHCFGLNLSVIKNEEMFNIVGSIDSLAWTFPYRFGRVKIFTRERMIEANSNGSLKEPEFYYVSLNATLDYVNFLNLRYRPSKYYNSKNKCNIFNTYGNTDNKFIYRDTALKMGISKQDISEFNTNEEIFELIIKQNKIFPRDSNLIISKIPIYTGSKFSFLEPKNAQISKFEFLYLFLSAIKLAYAEIQRKREELTDDFITSLKEFSSKLSESEVKLLEEELGKSNSADLFKNLLDIKATSKNFENLGAHLDNVISKLEFKLIKIKNPSQQINLEGKKIKKNHFIIL